MIYGNVAWRKAGITFAMTNVRCCVDQLSRQHKADMASAPLNVLS